jgi:hypothetical protein
LPGVAPVGFDAVARLFRHEGGGDAPAGGAFLRQVTREPVAAGTGCGDEDEWLALGLERSNKLVDSTLASPDRAAGDDFRAVFLGNLGDSNRRFVDIQSDRKRARLVHG